jgi:hypothetical protein
VKQIFVAADVPIVWDEQHIGKTVDERTNSFVTRENLDSVLVSGCMAWWQWLGGRGAAVWCDRCARGSSDCWRVVKQLTCRQCAAQGAPTCRRAAEAPLQLTGCAALLPCFCGAARARCLC